MRQMRINMWQFTMRRVDLFQLSLTILFFALDCKDLLFRMLTRIPQDRPRLEQCLAHNWFSDAENELDLSDESNVKLDLNGLR